MLFRDIIGQESVKRQLCLSVQEGRIPHAQLLTGPKGVGKLQLAVAYAQYLNCEHRTPLDACGTCPTCIQYQKLQHPDLHFAFPIVKGDRGEVCDDFVGDFRTLLLESGYFDIEDWYRTIGVETKQGMIYEKESSEILRKLSLKSFGNGYKVMIIWQPEKMNAVCANKLLKLLEEPPERTVFLLVSEHPEMLLTTILSRVQQVMVPRLDDQDIADALVRDGVDQQSAADLARIANGSYLAARQMAREQDETQRYLADFIALMRDAYTVGVITDRQKKFDSLQHLRKWSLDMSDSKVGRERQKNFLQYAQRQVRENFIRNFQTPELNYQTADERAFSDRFFPYINMGNVEAIVEQLSLAEQQIQQNGNAKMIFFDLCLQMIVLIKKKK